MNQKFEMNSRVEIDFNKIRKGDHHTFELLFKAYYRQLTRFAWRYVNSNTIAEELVQDVFANIWEKKHLIIINGSIKSYMYKSVRNQALNFLKHDSIRSEYDFIWAKERGMEKDDIINDNQSIKYKQIKIKKAIEDLPPRSRMAFKLNRHDGLTYQEIAEVMDISIKTVESQMSRALKTLRSKLQDSMEYLLEFD